VKLLKRTLTVLLLLFVGATVGMLVAQEVSHPSVKTADGRSAEAHAPPASDDVPSEVALSDEEAPPPAAFAEPVSTASETTLPAIEEPAANPDPSCVVEAIYFHNTARCRTCKKIEETAKLVLESGFPEAFASGRVRWSAINMEKQRHYVEEYELVKPTLVLVRTVGDVPDWIALDETWTLIRYEGRFSDYVHSSMEQFLEGCE